MTRGLIVILIVIACSAAHAGPTKAMPKGHYTSLAAIMKDGKAAIGKTALLSIRRQWTGYRVIYANSCGDNALKPYIEENTHLLLSFADADRDRVRGMPMGLEEKNCDPVEGGGGAVEVYLRVTGFDKTGVAIAKALAIFGQKVKATPPPKGADYATLEDMALDAKNAKGKIVVFRAFRSYAEPPSLNGCDIPTYEGDGGVTIYVRDADLALAKQISTVAKQCSAIRARVDRVGGFQTDWSVELLDVK